MGKRSTTTGYWRAHGDSKRVATAAPLPAVLAITGLDGTLPATAIATGKYLPLGAIPLRVEIKATGASGGTAPLVDIGLNLSTPDDNGLVAGAAADGDSSSALGSATDGVLIGTVLTETAQVTYGDGGGVNNTAGTLDVFIWYTFDDDGVAND